MQAEKVFTCLLTPNYWWYIIGSNTLNEIDWEISGALSYCIISKDRGLWDWNIGHRKDYNESLVSMRYANSIIP